MTRWLTLVTFLPLVGVAVLLVGRGLPPRAARWVALAVSLATFVVSLGMLGRFDPAVADFQMVEEAWWVRSIGLRYLLGVDGVSLWMVVLTTFLVPIAVLASWNVEDRPRLFMACLLALETGMVGSFLALDLLLFFLFFEAILFPMYLVIGVWGSERRIYAAVKFFLFTMFGSAFLLVAILVLHARSGALPGGPTFDIRAMAELDLPIATARLLFLAFLVAFAVKVPLFPLHTWLPDAHTEAPTAGSVILAAILLKVGAYGLIRFNLGLFPEASRAFAGPVVALALVGIVYGGVVAIVQRDLKRLVAYSSVSHLGFVVLGTFVFTGPALAGGVLQMVNHGLSTGALFLLVGMIYERTHTRDLARMGGLWSTAPLLVGAFLFVALSSIGLPGLNNFVGEFLVILGAVGRSPVVGAVAASGVVLAAVYLLWAFQRMATGPTPPEHRGYPDLSLREWLVLAPVLAAILAIGVYPKVVLDRIEPTTRRVLSGVGATPVVVPTAPLAVVEEEP
ncbi:NADH-quinone oxidoreductase subunit M [bacterium HR12]|nr:NADH-quinone oxidoreductase subunit M [bacterium HR12]